MPTDILPNLLYIPPDWRLVPVRGKRPFHKGWVDRQFDRLEILNQISENKATGLGLKLGNGLLAIDIDGESAANFLNKLAGENDLSILAGTTAWTSGRAGRKQLLFSVPETDWCRLKNLRIPTGTVGDDGKEEGIEFRWLGNQSVLPPSAHPDTGNLYYWLRSPLEFPPIAAPEWLIEICENWHSEYAGSEEIDFVRFPARLFPHFGRQLSIWLLSRRFDVSRQKSPAGKSTGSGIGKFSLLAASKILNRSQGHIRKLLCAAKRSGLLRNYKQVGNWVTCYYTKFEKVCAIAGLTTLGPIAAIEIDSLANIHIIATEVEAQALQKASLFKKRQEEIKTLEDRGLSPDRIPTRIVQPGALHTCEIPARVLARGSRFLFCEPGFEFYGGSQDAIAKLRNCSQSTISRHLSNRYRLEETAIRHQRSGIPPIVKKQLVEQLPTLRGMPAKLCTEDGLIFISDDWWKPHCNVYLLDHRLVSARRRRSRTKDSIYSDCLSKISGRRGGLEDKHSLSVFNKEPEGEQKLEPKNSPPNREKEKQKRSCLSSNRQMSQI